MYLFFFLQVDSKGDESSVDSNELKPFLVLRFHFQKENRLKVDWHQLKSLLKLIVLNSTWAHENFE
jgi:hypothetical protein